MLEVSSASLDVLVQVVVHRPVVRGAIAMWFVSVVLSNVHCVLLVWLLVELLYVSSVVLVSVLSVSSVQRCVSSLGVLS